MYLKNFVVPLMDRLYYQMRGPTMTRRLFLLGVGMFLIPNRKALAAMSKFVFKIKTKTGGIIGNILIEAKDQYAAIAILMKRYPGCEILEAKQK